MANAETFTRSLMNSNTSTMAAASSKVSVVAYGWQRLIDGHGSGVVCSNPDESVDFLCRTLIIKLKLILNPVTAKSFVLVEFKFITKTEPGHEEPSCPELE